MYEHKMRGLGRMWLVPWVCPESTLSVQNFYMKSQDWREPLKSKAIYVRDDGYSLWKQTTSYLFSDCLKSKLEKIWPWLFQKVALSERNNSMLSVLTADERAFSALRESSVSMREVDLLQNVPYHSWGSSVVCWYGLLMETKTTFWLSFQERLSNWNPLFVISCLTNVCGS